MCYALSCMWIWRRCLRCGVGACAPAFRLFWVTFVLYQLLVFAFQLISLLVLASSNDDLRTPALGAIDSITSALNGWSQSASRYSSDSETWLLMRLALSVAMILMSLLTVFFSTLRVVVIPAGIVGGKLNSGIYQSSATAWTAAATQFILMIPAAAMNVAWHASAVVESFIARRLLHGVMVDEPIRVVLSHVLTSLFIFLSMWLLQSLWVFMTPSERKQSTSSRTRYDSDDDDDDDDDSDNDNEGARRKHRRSERRRSRHSKHRAHSTDAGIRSRHHYRHHSSDDSTTADTHDASIPKLHQEED